MGRKRKRRPRTSTWGVMEPLTKSEIFDSRPEEIFALRKAIGWSRADLGNLLTIYINVDRRDCETVRRWERGLARPQKLHRIKLVILAEKFRDAYLLQINKIRNDATKQHPLNYHSNCPSEAGFSQNP
jgi:hypothetical protein